MGLAIRTVLGAALPAGLALLLAAAPALARTTVTGPFGTGLTEPVWVLQHLLGFLAVGFWTAQTGGRTLWPMPVAAVAAALAAGLAAQLFNVHLPYAGAGLTASLILLGLPVMLKQRVPPLLGALVVAVAAAFHGYLHMGGPLFWGGFAAGSLLVTCGGLGLAVVLAQGLSPRAVPVCGGAVAVAGLLDLLGVL